MAPKLQPKCLVQANSPLDVLSFAALISLGCTQAGTKVGPDQLGPPVWVGSTRIDSDRLGS